MYKRNEILYKVAKAYYIDHLTKTEIAKEFSVSRPTVQRFLEEAQNNGIVKISVHPESSNKAKIINQLKEKYNLQYISVTENNDDSNITKLNVSKQLVNFVEDSAYRLKTIGLGWGTTLSNFVAHTNSIDLHHLTIVPMMGGANAEISHIHSNHLCFSLAEKYRASVSYFYAPAICDDLNLKNELEQSRHVREAKRKAKNVDMAIVSVGSPLTSSTYKLLGNVSKIDEQNLKEKHIVGDVLASFFDKNGQIIRTNLSSKMIGSTLNELEIVKEVTVVANGIQKSESIFCLLKKGFIDNLIIDMEIANYLLDSEY
ncbi:sugar-binding transcriptional regulator [Streptococcus halichoeri]|uniref:sugar-binding transcriptional regulator n=1 Tax=Streptococcus halichoeri TaxID=254785 RepID=UPI0013572E8C|nr:sugar-binding domain-containing protein [Streptococcus halichoeri]